MENQLKKGIGGGATVRIPYHRDGLGAIRCSKCGRMYAFPRPVLNEYGAVISHGRPYCPSCKE